ncbi:NAD(P)H-hydrate dehydratase [Ascidiimonas sp. W6]|uniref:NAD(P)H-hydrate dehydratase n=1 Tax=Ascidiimonas meishanensis TaxID=3128903 RepID=UPI0030EE08B4
MKIFSANQLYEADKFTIKEQQISSTDLMERAGIGVFNWLEDRLQQSQVTIEVFCGIGNNGGDGLVIARHLLQNGYAVNVYIVNFSDKRSKDFLINLDRLKNDGCWPVFLSENTELPSINKEAIVIDAIFGIGLSRTPAIWVLKIIQHINKSNAFVLAIDIPSGLYMDKIPEQSQAIIHASHVISFQTPKLVFFLPETGIYMNSWEVIDIGLAPSYIQETHPIAEIIDKSTILSFYQPRVKYAHKGTYGHSLIVGGSHGKIGAVLLAAKACLCTGAGKVTAYIPSCGYIPFQSSLPEIMVETDSHSEIITSINISFKVDAIAIGMGMGTHSKSVNAFKTFLENQRKPLVLDADALNILGVHNNLLDLIPQDSILTPHPGELKRLVGSWVDDFDKIEKAKNFANKYKIVLVVKGAHTLIFHHKNIYINTTGNPGMATAGSGDVLAGMITSFISQGYSSLEASIFAVYLHGKAGDLALPNMGYQALTAGKIIDFIGQAFIELFAPPQPQNHNT